VTEVCVEQQALNDFGGHARTPQFVPTCTTAKPALNDFGGHARMPQLVPTRTMPNILPLNPTAMREGDIGFELVYSSEWKNRLKEQMAKNKRAIKESLKSVESGIRGMPGSKIEQLMKKHSVFTDRQGRTLDLIDPMRMETVDKARFPLRFRFATVPFIEAVRQYQPSIDMPDDIAFEVTYSSYWRTALTEKIGKNKQEVEESLDVVVRDIKFVASAKIEQIMKDAASFTDRQGKELELRNPSDMPNMAADRFPLKFKFSPHHAIQAIRDESAKAAPADISFDTSGNSQQPPPGLRRRPSLEDVWVTVKHG